MIRFICLITLLMAGACTRQPDVALRHDIHTDERFVNGRAFMFFHDHITKAGAIPSYRIKNGIADWHITIMVARNDLNYPKIQEAWSFGQELNYVRRDRFREFCSPRCRRVEHGEIKLSQLQFATYAQTGLAFQINGTRGVYRGTIPAALFAQVINVVASSP